ncbi:hypothetical protein CBOM_05681 [Ceraceosorus bombacis]|uniref:Uncharacterized protein n=1 Tax=Ceraceosorus bombacis TaxID=401625 RepID=A0A0P1BSQ1_9BASI|nr:hypothetical protein CBOM_05681 [Ceraceosorus bombacis]
MSPGSFDPSFVLATPVGEHSAACFDEEPRSSWTTCLDVGSVVLDALDWRQIGARASRGGHRDWQNDEWTGMEARLPSLARCRWSRSICSVLSSRRTHSLIRLRLQLESHLLELDHDELVPGILFVLGFNSPDRNATLIDGAEGKYKAQVDSLDLRVLWRHGSSRHVGQFSSQALRPQIARP